jgi:hypothetical protein
MSQVKKAAKTDAAALVLAAEVKAVDMRLAESIAALDQRLSGVINLNEKSVAVALVAAEKAVNAALVAADRAVAKAELASETRFSTMNEFRGQLADQAATFLPRAEYSAIQGTLDARLTSEENMHTSNIKRLEDKIAAISAVQIASASKSSGMDEAQIEARASAAARLNNRVALLFGSSVFLSVVSIVIAILEKH